MNVIIDLDIVVGIGTGDLAGSLPLPDHLDQTPVERLRVLNGTVVDASLATEFWIDDLGRKHIVALDPAWQRLSGGRIDAPIAKVDGAWTFVSAADAKKAALYDYAAFARRVRERAGIVIGNLLVPTDERTTNFLTAAYAHAKANPDFSIQKWKTGPHEYVALGNAQICAIGEAVLQHIQKLFEANAIVDDLIFDGEITVNAQINGYFDAL